jgi:hypothetical protein
MFKNIYMRTFSFIVTGIALSFISRAQLTIKGSIEQTETINSINVLFAPNYTSARGEYVNYLNISIALPAIYPGKNLEIEGQNNFKGLRFTPAYGFGYVEGDERIFSWICVNPVPTPMSWNKDVPFTGAIITFPKSAELSSLNKIRLIDFSKKEKPVNDNSFFTISTNRPNDATDYNNLFYAISGNNSSIKGRYDNSDQFVEVTIAKENNIARENMISKREKNAPDKYSIASVIPNPALSLVTVSINSSKKDHITLGIVDMYGKTINQKSVNIEIGQNLIPFQIDELASGVYLIKIISKTANTKIETVKFIKE